MIQCYEQRQYPVLLIAREFRRNSAAKIELYRDSRDVFGELPNMGEPSLSTIALIFLSVGVNL